MKKIKSILIEDLIKEKGIAPKNIYEIDETILKNLKEIFKEFKCSKCLNNLCIKIERKKEDNILYININCKNDHKDFKELSRFLKENKFTIENDFTFYDLVPSDIRKRENGPNTIKLKRCDRSRTIRISQDTVFFQDEYYLICFKCKKIFNLKYGLKAQINHEHFLFEYDILNNYNDEERKNSKHFFLKKDIDYLENKIKHEEKYYKRLNEILIENKIRDKYIAYLKQIELEIYFFKCNYELYINNKTKTLFTNITNIFNHNIINYKLDNSDKNVNKNIKKEIDNLNNELLSIYSLNTFNNKEKFRLCDYEQYSIKPPNSVFVTTSLDEPYFAAGGLGLYVYKIGKNIDKKYKIDLISKINNINVFTMIYLNNQKLIVGGCKGIFLIKYNKEFKNYNIIFNVNKNNSVDNIIKTYNNYFISLENKKYIIKWIINKEENDTKKLFYLNNNKGICNICDLNKKYFAYQTQEFIYIMYHKNFKEHLKINYKLINFSDAINKITEEIIGVTSSNGYQIDFFNIETGDKICEISDENHIFKGILRSKREKKDIELITLNEHIAYQRSCGFCSDYIYNNNKWEKISIIPNRLSNYIRHFFEMNDNTMLISAQADLYILLYSQ